MSFISHPVYIITVLLLLAVMVEWLGHKKFFSHLGPALMIIIAAALLSNFGLLPSS